MALDPNTGIDTDFEPGPLPSPTPDPRVFINQYPAGYGAPSGNLQLINDLGYNPSYPYGSSGSGVPTQRGIGLLGGLLGSGLGGLLLPGLGSLLGGKLGGVGARMLTRYIQGQGMNKQPGTPPSATAGTVATGGLEDATGSSPPSGGGRGFFDRWSASGTPGVGVGIDPTGNPAVGREWWSNDFGRWNLGESGQGAGGYDLAGPGGGFGQRGTGFGAGTVGNFGTAIGFGGNLGGGGPTNLSPGGARATALRPLSPDDFSRMKNLSGFGKLFGGGAFQWTPEMQAQWQAYQANPHGYVSAMSSVIGAGSKGAPSGAGGGRGTPLGKTE